MATLRRRRLHHVGAEPGEAYPPLKYLGPFSDPPPPCNTTQHCADLGGFPTELQRFSCVPKNGFGFEEWHADPAFYGNLSGLFDEQSTGICLCSTHRGFDGPECATPTAASRGNAILLCVALAMGFGIVAARLPLTIRLVRADLWKPNPSGLTLAWAWIACFFSIASVSLAAASQFVYSVPMSRGALYVNMFSLIFLLMAVMTLVGAFLEAAQTVYKVGVLERARKPLYVFGAALLVTMVVLLALREFTIATYVAISIMIVNFIVCIVIPVRLYVKFSFLQTSSGDSDSRNSRDSKNSKGSKDDLVNELHVRRKRRTFCGVIRNLLFEIFVNDIDDPSNRKRREKERRAARIAAGKHQSLFGRMSRKLGRRPESSSESRVLESKASKDSVLSYQSKRSTDAMNTASENNEASGKLSKHSSVSKMLAETNETELLSKRSSRNLLSGVFGSSRALTAELKQEKEMRRLDKERKRLRAQKRKQASNNRRLLDFLARVLKLSLRLGFSLGLYIAAASFFFAVTDQYVDVETYTYGGLAVFLQYFSVLLCLYNLLWFIDWTSRGRLKRKMRTERRRDEGAKPGDVRVRGESKSFNTNSDVKLQGADVVVVEVVGGDRSSVGGGDDNSAVALPDDEPEDEELVVPYTDDEELVVPYTDGEVPVLDAQKSEE